MQIQLEYGRIGLSVDIPDDRLSATLSYKDAVPLESPVNELREVLREPLGTLPLRHVASGCENACIVICDITRPVPNQLILEQALAELSAAGVPEESITILIATGLHRASTQSEIVEMLGEDIADTYNVISHDGHDETQLVFLGMSPRQVPIWVNKHFIESDVKITVGLIEPHFMAGFSGGRKLICPGICGVETIREWHSPRFLEHPNARSGVLKGNPVHEENSWIAERIGCDFIINVVIDDQRRPLKFVAGDMKEAFYEGAAFCKDVVTAIADEPADIVVTSSAGYPLDITFYQSVKGMSAALPVIKQGGTIILAASMSEGIGSEPFQQLFQDHDDIESFMRAIHDPEYFVMDQWQMEKLAEVLRKANVIVVTDGLKPEVLSGLYVESAESVEAAIEQAVKRHGDDATIAVIPKWPYVLAGLGSSEED